jgi:hypothetical protein
MSTEELLNKLTYAGLLADVELIRACLEHREELTPSLLPMLEHHHDTSWSDDDPRWSAAVHAGLLLIAFREPAALPIFSTIFRGNVEEVDALMEWFQPQLPAYGPTVVPYFIAVINDEQASDYGHSLALEVITEVALFYPESRDQIVAQLREYLPPLPDDETRPISLPTSDSYDPLFYTWLTVTLLRLRDTASRDQVVAMHQHGLIDEGIMGPLESYLEDLEKPLEEPRFKEPGNILELYKSLHEREQYAAQVRAEAEQRRKEEQKAALRAASQTRTTTRVSQPPPAPARQQTVVRSQPKIGRNDPCPCGSGRKYKHCCGR